MSSFIFKFSIINLPSLSVYQKKGQETTKKCSNCLKPGHWKVECTAATVCLACGGEGHRRGECNIEATSSAGFPVRGSEGHTKGEADPQGSPQEEKKGHGPTPSQQAITAEVVRILKQVKTMEGTRKQPPRHQQSTRKKRMLSGTVPGGSIRKKKDVRRTPVLTFEEEDDGWEQADEPQEPKGKLDTWLSQSSSTVQPP